MRINPTKIFSVYCLWALMVVSMGCNITKNVPAGDALYTGATLDLNNSSAPKKENKIVEADLEASLRPKPNSTILGFPFKLGIYNLAGKKNNFINKFLRKSGEPPVLLSQLNLDRNVLLVENTLVNKGFFHAKAIGDTTVKDKKASAHYVADAGIQYTIDQVTFPQDSSKISAEIRKVSDVSILKKGDAFNLDVIKGERLRIDIALKEKGFYFFNPEDLIILVDSTIGSNLTNLHVQFKPEVSMLAKQPYVINNIYIYSNYNLNTAAKDTLKNDSVLYEGYYVIDRKKTFNPKVFKQMMLFQPGDLYNRTDHNASLN